MIASLKEERSGRMLDLGLKLDLGTVLCPLADILSVQPRKTEKCPDVTEKLLTVT